MSKASPRITAVPRLIFHAQQANYVPADPSGLCRDLQKLGLLGPAFSCVGGPCYLSGERFLQLLSFLGCAPTIRLEPTQEQDESFCHLRLRTTTMKPEFLAGRNLGVPRCPHCRNRVTDWQERVDSIQEPTSGLVCPHCQAHLALAALDWNKTAGYARFFLEVYDIHPHEAVPTPGLMNALSALSGQDWQYFYYLP